MDRAPQPNSSSTKPLRSWTAGTEAPSMIGWMMSLQSVYGRDLGAGGGLLAQATRATPLSESVLGQGLSRCAG